MVVKAFVSLLLFIMCQIQVSHTSVVVQVRFVMYENPEGLADKAIGYGCCDVSLDSNPASNNCSLSDLCDTLFDVCVSQPFASQQQQRQCAPGQNRTQVFYDTNSLDFLLDPAVPDTVFNFTLNTWQGHISLAVGTSDDDAGSSGAELIMNFVNASIPLDPEPFTTGANGSNPVLVVFQDWPANLSVEVKAWCSADYFGVNCSTLCRESKDLHNGYYTCNSDGSKICRPGYTGVDCRSPASTLCDRHPCRNGGTCGHGTPVSYLCRCLPLFTGTNCETSLATTSASASHSQRTPTGHVVSIPSAGSVPPSLQPRQSTGPATTPGSVGTHTARPSLTTTAPVENSTHAERTDFSKAIIIGSTLGAVLLLAAVLTLAILCCCCCSGCCCKGTSKVRPAQRRDDATGKPC